VLERLPEPEAPPQLARSVLAKLAAQRAPRRPVAKPVAPIRPAIPAPSRSLTARRILIAATILVAVGTGAWLWSSRVRPANSSSGDRDVVDSTPVAPAPLVPQPSNEPRQIENALEDPPEDLLASLEMLESWELLTDDRIEAELIALEGLDALLIETAEAAESDSRPQPVPGTPTKG
jgi:hypothetical protein